MGGWLSSSRRLSVGGGVRLFIQRFKAPCFSKRCHLASPMYLSQGTAFVGKGKVMSHEYCNNTKLSLSPVGSSPLPRLHPLSPLHHKSLLSFKHIAVITALLHVSLYSPIELNAYLHPLPPQNRSLRCQARTYPCSPSQAPIIHDILFLIRG
jgi:hypothetical protein